MAERPPATAGTRNSPHTPQAEPAELLSTRISAAGPLTTVQVQGELDMDTAHLLTSAVEEGLLGHPRILLLDLAAVAFCDCAGLRTLLRTRRRITEAGATFHLASTSRAVLRIMDLTGTAGALDARPTLPPPRSPLAVPATARTGS
ncbi:STAS domain-containing protein [Kitasatospora sp. NPDC057223]|uniref:STAS domain-containing protein n=1 Tax=Kitasatospora sp. NPDC057223 TaxID=3346055 RepID=UPI003638BE56